MATKVLIVEDETALRHALGEKLKEEGFEVLSAANGVDGLEVALKEHPALILLDLMMPKMDGQTMLENLRQDNWGKGVPVIVLSNKDANQDILSALRAGTLDYFIKSDTSLKDIVAAVKDRLRKNS